MRIGSAWREAVLRLMTACFLALLALSAASAPARAQNESVELDTSTREIAIKPDFNGAEIVIFGAVDNSQQTNSASGYYDIIIVIRGPAETITARQKERMVGLWVNGNSRTFDKVPSFYGVLSTRPITDVTDADTLRRFDIEFNPTPLEENRAPPDDFERALVRIKEREGMYVKAPFAVVFLSRSLFRATLRMPPRSWKALIPGRSTCSGTKSF
ncbi:MAG: hypothetical protein HC850_13805 [Rhodomicrobium sp.]|nr:hypothetical protein [Rhodomicrobium sp.]